MNTPQHRPGPVVVEQAGQAWAWIALEITAAYDLARLADFARLAPAERLEYAVREQAAYLDRLQALRTGEVVALRWISTGQRRLRAWLVGRVHAPSVPAATSRAHELSQLLGDVPRHVAATAVEQAGDIQDVLTPFTPASGGMAQVGKRLRVQEPERPDAGVATYLAVEPFAQALEDWTPLLEALSAYPHPISLTVALTPQDIPPALRRALESEATRYAHLREPLDVPADVGGRIRYPADSAAAAAEPVYRDALHRYTGRVFRYTITLASPRPLDEMVIEAVGRTISPAHSAPVARHDPTTVATGYTVTRPHDAAEHDRLRDMQAAMEPTVLPDPELLHHLAADPDQRRHPLVLMRELVDRTEARSLFRLPIALDGYIPGFPVRARPDPQRAITSIDGPSVTIGYQDEHRSAGAEVNLPVAALARHSFIVGTPGSGKTNTALHLCRQLWNHQIPFLVIEPVNAELNDYRWLATQPDFDDLLVFTVGDESVAPLRLNPFEVPTGLTVAAHLSNLLACFEAAFGLWDPLPFIYRRALTRAYRRRGLHPDDRGDPERAGHWPVLADLAAELAAVTAELGYTGDVGHNIDAAGKLRAEALAEGACATTLNCRRSFDIATLLQRPVVVELAGVGDNAKEQALITLLLLNAVRGHRRGTAGVATTPHAMILEEAHRVFPRATPSRGGDTPEANASALAAERIAQGLAEDRKYQQAYILIDQQVTKVAEDAYKITNLKIMHRTAAADDRDLLGSTMTMHLDQVQAAAGLAPFQAVVSHNQLDQAVTVQVPNVRGDDAAARDHPEAPLADGGELRDRHTRLMAEPAFAEALAPHEECHACRHRCAFRQQAESVAADLDAASHLVALAQPGQDGWQAVARELAILAGPPPAASAHDPAATEDYLVCVFIHALRATYPAGHWNDEGRRRAIRWSDLARQELADLDGAVP